MQSLQAHHLLRIHKPALVSLHHNILYSPLSSNSKNIATRTTDSARDPHIKLSSPLNATAMASTNPVTFAPAFPMPRVFDVQERIRQLRSFLDASDPWYQPEPQHININAAIKLYEDGKLDGIQQVYISNGEVVTREEARSRKTWSWSELRMLLRLIPDLGGDGTVHGIIAMNDTGSDVLTIFDADIPLLGNSDGYAGWVGPVAISDASGAVGFFPKIRVEVQMVDDNNLPWSDWILEDAIVRPVTVGVPRLSGYGIREALYFGTGPGNHVPAASATKGAAFQPSETAIGPSRPSQ
ncbi:MAG: hypothetical protein M1840_000508 [Geoglossum simile]|nr:MAG: hypothetical protein M1840_000508 [Geoglossum simile]